ncbi:acetyltransferase [Alsobacter metallidurans]|uniref:Acetyltransferase n=1 Tax=Alsobacter metallidurans TaxID=340221 RepID=A0A917I9I9_9HYPH|nr:GNAT family N-acetyltransferase [Alsobacter metallidurans]GGH24824.1 acetyltransferase [Alsobacter metallidurans]
MSRELLIREATASDLEAVVALHGADALGAHGDAWTPDSRTDYERAFAAIARHPDHTLYVAEAGGEVLGTFLLSFLPGLTGRGALHAQLRSVQVRADQRSGGIGARLLAFAEAEARRRGAAVMELMSSMRRVDAHRFYERHGYGKTHFGFKKRFGPA